MKKIDYYLLGAVVILVILGILILTSVSASFSQEKTGKATYYLFHQLFYGLIPALIIGFIFFKINLGKLRKYSGILVLISFALMLVVFIPGLGIISGGAPRWINLKFATFQPSEALKLFFIVYLAAWLVNPAKREKFIKNRKEVGKSIFKRIKNEGMGLVPFLMVLTSIIGLLIFQKDMSTLIVIIGSAVVMYFVAKTPLWHTVMVTLLCSGGAYLFIRFSFRAKRILVFLNPNIDPMGIGYQIKQVLIAVGSGGMFGLGLGASVQKFGFIPQTMADSIFAIYAEELGFIWSMPLVLLYLFLFWRGMRIFKKAKDPFSRFLAIGISFWLCFQAFFNIGAMLGVLPLTGIPLPFISYGGSHLIMEIAGIGLLLNISKK